MDRPKRPLIYGIPDGTPQTKCLGENCGATIWFVPSGRTHPDGNPKFVPVNADGSPHYTTCVDAEKFRKP
jgi:hypothetical protein